jgi:outer membrane protein assembly factor BamB
VRHRLVSVLLLSVTCTTVAACRQSEWTAFRRNASRTASLPVRTRLSDPARVPALTVGWSWQSPGAASFRASPVVSRGRVHIGAANGILYTLNASSGAVLWQYPPGGSAPLTSTLTCNPSSRGIASSATVATVAGVRAVIFGATDRSLSPGLGSGRLFALNAETGTEIWKSPAVAVVNGTTPSSTAQLHEQIGYSSPVVYNGRVYVGIADHCDNPIQNGKVVAVELSTGNVIGTFAFSSTNTRGGGIWSSVAAANDALFVTTGNVRCWNGGCQPEPSVNHSLSLLKLNASSGSVLWKHQPVPFVLDDDPDWASTPSVMNGSCGTLVLSTMKDGWTYAVESGTATAAPAAVRWQFPPTGFPFAVGDGTAHGDSRFLRPGAVWGDVYLTNGGGLNLTTNLYSNYSRLHALNACAAAADRIRWIKDIPGVSGPYSLSPPTTTRGMFYIGTRTGQLIVIADPSLSPPAGYRCAHPDVLSANCVGAGFTLVPDPAILATIQLQGAIHTEPVLIGGQVYVATDNGWLYQLTT